MKKTPFTTMNIPNRDYWLSGEREAETRSYLARTLLWFGGWTIAFVVGVMHLTIRANLDETYRLGSEFWYIFVGYLAYTAWWSIRMVLRFSRVPRDGSAR